MIAVYLVTIVAVKFSLELLQTPPATKKDLIKDVWEKKHIHTRKLPMNMVITSEVFLQKVLKWRQPKRNPTNELLPNDFRVNKQILAHCNYLLMVQFSAWWQDFHVFTTKPVISETPRCLRYGKNWKCYNMETNCPHELYWKTPQTSASYADIAG